MALAGRLTANATRDPSTPLTAFALLSMTEGAGGFLLLLWLIRAGTRFAEGQPDALRIPPTQIAKNQMAHMMKITMQITHVKINGGAPSCPGQHPKGVLMDAQTVIAVCELLLVIVALFDFIDRRDE